MPAEILHPLEALMRQRIVVLDGAMGTMVQQYKLTEADYRGARFKDWKGKDLKGSIELLLLTKPAVIDEIHTRYLQAGADIIETNTFSATTIGLHDFLFAGEPESGRKDPEFFQRVVDDPDFRDLVREINAAAARVARHAADTVANETGQRRFVAGSLGPLPVTASLSPDVNDPSFRAVTFDQIRQAYCGPGQRASGRRRGFPDGGNHFRHPERKSRDRSDHGDLREIRQDRSADHLRHGDRSFRTDPERPDRRSIPDFNRACEAIGRGIELRARAAARWNRTSKSWRTAPPATPAPIQTPACPIRFRPPAFLRRRKVLAPQLQKWARNGWLNIVGGCCGTTPDHIRAIADAVRDCRRAWIAKSGERRASRMGTAEILRDVLFKRAFHISTGHGENMRHISTRERRQLPGS